MALGAAGCGSDAPVEPEIPPVPVASVSITSTQDSAAAGTALWFTVELRDSAGTLLEDRPVTWASTDTAVALISAPRIVTLMGPGSAAIIATCEGKADTVTVTALPAVIPSGRFAAHWGLPGNDGGLGRPWPLQTALGAALTPGDTLWVRGGTYRGTFTSYLAGAAGQPVVVRAYPGERVILDHAGSALNTLTVTGSWSEFHDLEVTNSDPDRSASVAGSEQRPNAIVNEASHTRYLRLVVHDAGVGFYTYSSTEDVEVAGSVFYNNGWQGPDRGHGHALYVKSDAGPLVLRDNVLFNQYGYGVHAYTERGSGALQNIQVIGNIAFNNGTLAATPTGENILVGGLEPAAGTVVRDNATWFPFGLQSKNMRIGYGTLTNADAVVEDNYVVGGSPVLTIGAWDALTVSGNVLAGTDDIVALQDPTLAGYVWGASQHFRDPLSPSWIANGVPLPFAVWQLTTGLGLSDVVGGGLPGAAHVVMRPNAGGPGRAFIAVYNWGRASAALVDVSSILAPGDPYGVYNVQRLSDPLSTGTYTGGAIALPLGGVDPPIPFGLSSTRAPRTGPDFDVFLVRKMEVRP
jgi:hypothetical protein